MKKILFFKTKDLCYESNTVFINEMSKSFRKYGVAVDTCEITSEEHAAEELEKYAGKHFDACIDFNSVTPRAVFDDGTPFLDTVDAPFFNYIVDHPFYHHPILKLPLKNYHVLCLDENHVKYVQKYYPHIKSVHFLPLGAMKGMVEVPYDEKATDILFTGTYYKTGDIYLDEIKKQPEQAQRDMKSIIDMMLSNPSMNMEQCLARVLEDTGREVTDQQFMKLMNQYYNAEFYVRSYNRNALIGAILQAEMAITVLGNGWDEYETPYQKYLKRKRPVGYALSLEMILHARMLLNILPNFKGGIHDRVLSAMVNHTISITDTSTYLQRNFVDEEELLFYELNHMDRLPGKIDKVLSNPALGNKIAEQGYRKAINGFTWDARIEEFLKILENL